MVVVAVGWRGVRGGFLATDYRASDGRSGSRMKRDERGVVQQTRKDG